jgi:hypothetical protein
VVDGELAFDHPLAALVVDLVHGFCLLDNANRGQ